MIIGSLENKYCCVQGQMMSYTKSELFEGLEHTRVDYNDLKLDKFC